MATDRTRVPIGPPVCDGLERRVLLSTINWVNKGTPTSDTDGFTAAYGPLAERARGIVQRAVDDWERIIVNFNRSGGGTNTYNLTVDSADLTGSIAVTRNVTYDAQGKPNAGRVTMDNTGAQFYFDPLVGPSHLPDDGEFTFIESPFQASNIAVTLDFYSVVTHEIGHAMGLASNANRLLSLGTDIGPDPNDAEGRHLFTINTNGVPGADFTYTTAGGVHLYEGPSVAGCPVHPMDLMNPARAHSLGRRNLITDTFAILLRDVYAYTIQMPSQQNTFYVNLDTAAQRVTINGDINPNGNDDDTIDLRISSGFQKFGVNGTLEGISIPNFFSTVVNANNGNDFITVDSMWGTLDINGGAGHDTLDVCPQSHDLFETPHGITFNGGSGVNSVRLNDSAAARTDTFTINPTFVGRPAFTLNMTGTISNLELTGQNGNNIFNLNADPATHYHFDGAGGLADALILDDTAATTGKQYTIRRGVLERPGSPDLTFATTTEQIAVNAGSGSDTFTWIPGDVYGLVNMNGGGGGGNDALVIDDRADAGDDNYLHFGTLFQKSIFGLPQGGNLPTTFISGFETQTLQANQGNNVIELYNGDEPLRVFANGGNDRVEVNDGTATVNTGPETASGVFPFGDTLVVNEDASTGEDIPGVAIIAQDDEVRDLEVLNAQTLGTLRILGGATLTRSAGPGSGFNVLGVIDLAGGALLMRAPAGTLDGWRLGVTNGRNGGAWNGVSPIGAINSSLAHDTPIGDGVGYGLGSQIGISTIGSFAIGADDTLVRYALYGDANLDGRVNLSDFNRVAANFGGTNRHWTSADFNYDGTVNLQDFNLLAGNFGQAVAAGGVAGTGAGIPFTSQAAPLRRLLPELA